MSAAERPWLAHYDAGKPRDLSVEFANALDMFSDSVRRSPESPLIHYLDRTLTVTEVDAMSDALAVALLREGVAAGDRVAVYLQNVPQFMIGMLAIWKTGAIMVPINAMYREREVTSLLTDSGAVAIICLESLYRDVVAGLRDKTDVRFVITTSELDYQGSSDSRVFAGIGRERHPGTLDFCELIEAHVSERPPPVDLTADSLAFLGYTSGTPGPAKGAMNTHGNVVFIAQVYRDWLDMTSDDVILGMAPLFHITGLMGHMALSMLLPAPLVLGYRFEPDLYLELIERYEITFTIGSITAFVAMLNGAAKDRRGAMASLAKVYTGGQSVPPAVLAAFEADTGHYIRIAYGLTETTSPTHFVPLHSRSPIDPVSGAVSIGVPVFNTTTVILDDNGVEVAPGELGELCVAGPQLVAGYWEKEEETANAFRDGWFHTGDIAVMDASGWFYIVDRKKDMINVSGNKVWPREVEEVLYLHPAIREAAVIGVSDDYRGEIVKAFVSLRPGQTVTEAELREFCKSRMASYKYPRSVEFLEELPKTASGKVMRRELRHTMPPMQNSPV